jgi:hypothetical protein
MTKSKLVLCNQDSVLQEEIKRRKQLRLLQVIRLIISLNIIFNNYYYKQVRELSKQNAAKVRNAFKKEKDKQIKSLQNNIQVRSHISSYY